MRFKNPSQAGKRSQEVQAENRMRLEVDRIDRPKIGLLLHTIRVESHLSGVGFEIKVKQAKRLNQINVETFGTESQDHGLDWLCKHLRKKLVTRWIR